MSTSQRLHAALAELAEVARRAGLDPEVAMAEGRQVAATVAEPARGAFLDWAASLGEQPNARTFFETAAAGRRWRSQPTPLVSQLRLEDPIAAGAYASAMADIAYAAAGLGEDHPQVAENAAAAAAAQRRDPAGSSTRRGSTRSVTPPAEEPQDHAERTRANEQRMRDLGLRKPLSDSPTTRSPVRSGADPRDILIPPRRSTTPEPSTATPPARFPWEQEAEAPKPQARFPWEQEPEAPVPPPRFPWEDAAPTPPPAPEPEPIQPVAPKLPKVPDRFPWEQDDPLPLDAEESWDSPYATLPPSSIPTATVEDEEEGEPEPDKSLDELLEELDQLIGLPGVKSEIHRQAAILRVEGLRRQAGLRSPTITRHLIFVGNPGTGKTTVARLVAGIYKALGLLSQGQLVEVDRSSLVAGFLGQTAIKTSEVVATAAGGVLFVDEAYSLNGDQYGEEAINQLVKEMEDRREDLVVIVAGYPSPMTTFIDNNPGLSSRFRTTITFENYSDDELVGIFTHLAEQADYDLSPDAPEAFRSLLVEQTRDDTFGNGRFARNVLEAAIGHHAWRLRDELNPSMDVLRTLVAEDVRQDWSKVEEDQQEGF